MYRLYRFFCCVTALVLTLVTFAGPASAQTNAGLTLMPTTLSGHVLDQRGAGVSDAVIVATGGGKTHTAKTTSGGLFSLTLPAGVYQIVVNKGGYQSAENDDFVATPGAALTLTIALNESNLQSLRVIGRTSTTVNRTPFNVTETAVSTLPADQLGLRETTNLTDTIAELPGVIAARTTSSTPNTNFVIRGEGLQTRVTIDGAPVSAGSTGMWNTNYATSGIFQNVEVVKGAGLNGALAGESAVGTVNLKTRDFTTTNSAGVQFGDDSYGGGIYNAFADVNFLNNRASILVAKSFYGDNGPWNDVTGNRLNTTNMAATPAGVGVVPTIPGLVQWQGDFSNRYSLDGELAKFRYRLSGNTSVTLEYLGLEGQYTPQGGAYATYDGQTVLQACENGKSFQPTFATCNASSTYGAPYAFNMVGQTVPTYTWFPNSFIQNNEPQFSAEFRTTLNNDTIIFRPYTHLINRFISGAFENEYPGNDGGWFAVTNTANCQVGFVAPGAKNGPASGAAGPCFSGNFGQQGVPYIGTSTTPHLFTTTNAAPVCSPTPPYTCFTTPTAAENNGQFAYGTPFSQPELDRLNGYTFNYIHPVGNNVYNFSYDYRSDYTAFNSGDGTLPAAGCNYVVGSVTGAAAAQFQPNCQSATAFGSSSPLVGQDVLPRSPISTPPTLVQYFDASLTGQFQLTDKLQLALGNYFEVYRAQPQIENPAVLNQFAQMGNAAAAPVSLITDPIRYAHYDPHIGLEYRVDRDLSLRANAGSSITQPFAGVISGFGSISTPNAANGETYSINTPNVNLAPETTVAYDTGLDYRLKNGAVLSVDAYDNLIHNVFLSSESFFTPSSALAAQFPTAQVFVQSQEVNGGLNQNEGLELSLYKSPARGIGYYVSGTLDRSYNEDLPLNIYLANTKATNGNTLINYVQPLGIPYFKSYAQIFVNGARGAKYELGMDFEGNNNSAFAPPYAALDSAIRIPLSHGVTFQLSAENLANVNLGTGIGRALLNQGEIRPTVFLNPATGQVVPGAGLGLTPIQALPPRDIRFSFNYGVY